MTTTPAPRSDQQTTIGSPSSVGKARRLLSKSMEKTFRRYRDRPAARHAFAEAEGITFLAHQIRVLRTQRGWTQAQLAKRIGSTQAGVSRLEDPSYGRVTIPTMMALAKAFDVAPVFKFMSIIDLMRERWVIRADAMRVRPFAEEADEIGFYGPVQNAPLQHDDAVVVSLAPPTGALGNVFRVTAVTSNAAAPIASA